jgi:ABC-type transport system involved in multi-copper enzyme maturation permease subunit
MTWKKSFWTLYKEITMDANLELKRVKEWAWMRGFANLYKKESRAWWSTKRWWINGLLWQVLTVLCMLLMVFILPALSAATGDMTMMEQLGGLVKMGTQGFFEVAAMVITIGLIVLCQDLVIGEKQSGLTEWLLANPVQRKAYVLAKLCAMVLAILLLLVALPGITAYVLISLGAGGPLPLQPYLAGMAIFILHSLFYLILTLMLGVFCGSRSAILGISIGIFFFGLLFAGFLQPLLYVSPWILPKYSSAIAASQVPPGSLWPPIIATALWCVVFTCAAVIKFERTEF